MDTTGTNDESLNRPVETRAGSVIAELEQATQELRASRKRSRRAKVEIDRLTAATDEVLSRIKARLTEA